jgi:hypothetical protein
VYPVALDTMNLLSGGIIMDFRLYYKTIFAFAIKGLNNITSLEFARAA